MAVNQTESVDAISAIKTSPDKFYNYFKFNMNELVKIAPHIYTAVQMIEGEEGKVGCVKKKNFILGEIPMTATVKLVEIDDAGKSLKFSTIAGDVLVLYKSMSAAFVFSEGQAKCTLTYEKATPLSLPPEAYASLFVSVFKLMDAHLQNI